MDKRREKASVAESQVMLWEESRVGQVGEAGSSSKPARRAPMDYHDTICTVKTISLTPTNWLKQPPYISIAIANV